MTARGRATGSSQTGVRRNSTHHPTAFFNRFGHSIDQILSRAASRSMMIGGPP